MAKSNPKKTMIMERIAPLAESFGVTWLDVETVRENERSVLRLIIDKRGGVGIDDCVALSEVADPIVSEELGLTDHDVFEVQSAGLDRPLAETADLLRHLGEAVDVKLYQARNGQKIIEGVLENADAETVWLGLDDGTTQEISRKDAATIRRGIRF